MTNPAHIARADQHYAMVSEQLDSLVKAYTAVISRGLTGVQARDEILCRLFDPSNGDGTEIPHLAHVGTLANLLTVAIDRLAASPSDSCAKPEPPQVDEPLICPMCEPQTEVTETADGWVCPNCGSTDKHTPQTAHMSGTFECWVCRSSHNVIDGWYCTNCATSGPRS